MATLRELRDERLRKLEELKKLGVNPYPAQAERTHKLAEISAKFNALEGKRVSVVGRITNIRKFGKIAFIVVRDDSGSLQLFLSEDKVEPLNAKDSQLGFGQLPLLDIGDFMEAQGEVSKTQTGEISVYAQKIRLLTKSLRPLPGYNGFTNKEERFRRRYVDMNVNEDVRERFVRRSKFWQATRDFLNQNDFIEMNIPVLEHTTGGADANPFVTHMNALDQDFYLRISQELPLKRLIGGGYEKVYDIGPRFRNENYTDEHLPEHVAMEWYWAYANWRDGMKFMTDMYRYVLQNTFGTLQFKLDNFEVDLSQDWEEWDYAKVIQDRYGIDPFNTNLDDVKKALKDNNLEVEQTENLARGIDKLWKNVRKDVAGPVWLINTPTFISPLAKVNPDNQNTVQRFQAVVAGSELCNGYSELNDPVDQLQRFIEQQKMRDAGDHEAMMLDIDFVEMLEYGMPPTCGLGYSERVFWIFEGVTAREGVPFPQLRREIDEVTKGIYPEVYGKDGLRNVSTSRPQDFSKKIVTVVNKELEPWQVANAVAHMDAIIGNELPKDQLVSGDYFVSNDEIAIPRNSQYPIIIMRADDLELHKLHQKVLTKKLIHHVFIKEMQDTTNDDEIVNSLKNKPLPETIFYGVSFIAPNDEADELTKGLQLWR
jgi:lysyl-tRNA synthetase class 2